MPTRRSLLAFPLLAALAGCTPEDKGSPGTKPGGGGAPPGGGAGGSSAGGFKVALMTAGALADNGWNTLAGKGIERIKTELGADTSHATATTAEAEEQLRGFARDGYKLVFAHGNEFKDAAKAVAGENPGVAFVVSSGDVEGPNLASLSFKLGEAAYLAGMAAAGLSKSGKAGQIGGQSFPPVKEAFDLFLKGARSVKPSFAAPATYVGGWTDANRAKELALGMIKDGADILFQNCDAAGEGVFAAAGDTKDKRVLVFGSNANQNDLMPKLIVGSAVIDVAKSFVEVAKAVKAGTFKGGILQEDLKSGCIYLALNEAFKSEIPAEILAKIAAAEADIKAGKLKV